MSIRFLPDASRLDPIDGTAIRAGDACIACSCGLIYRHMSVVWLSEFLSGRCVGCDSPIFAPKPHQQDSRDLRGSRPAA